MWEVEQARESLAAARQRGDVEPAALDAARWLVEELRVSLFAQALGTAQPVSVQRIARLLARQPGARRPRGAPATASRPN